MPAIYQPAHMHIRITVINRIMERCGLDQSWRNGNKKPDKTAHLLRRNWPVTTQEYHRQRGG